MAVDTYDEVLRDLLAILGIELDRDSADYRSARRRLIRYGSTKFAEGYKNATDPEQYKYW